MLTQNERKKVVLILLLITISEGAWVFFMWWQYGSKFWKYLGFTTTASPAGWVAAGLVVVSFVTQGLRLPSVRQHLFYLSSIKFLSFLLAFCAGILEEVFFRKMLMDWLKGQGHAWLLQALASGLVFGLLHGIWGLFGRNIRAAAGATVATGILGSALAIVYIASGRILAPCIIAHFLINALMEPGLVIAAVKGEMGGGEIRSISTTGN